MAAYLLLIKFFAVAVAFTVFDFVTLIDGVIRDNLTLMKSSVCKTFSDDCTSKKNRSRWGGTIGAVVLVFCWGGHPLNCWGDTLCRRWVVDRKTRGVGRGNGVILWVLGLLDVGARCLARHLLK